MPKTGEKQVQFRATGGHDSLLKMFQPIRALNDFKYDKHVSMNMLIIVSITICHHDCDYHYYWQYLYFYYYYHDCDYDLHYSHYY